MKKINVIYFSNTGNTEAMAEAVAEGAKSDETEVKLMTFDEASIDDVLDADAVALGCPACGTEELDDGEVQPFIDELEGKVEGKDMVLFGSYGWGGGPWMETWEEQMTSFGVNLVADSVIIEETPEEEGLEECRALGEKLK